LFAAVEDADIIIWRPTLFPMTGKRKADDDAVSLSAQQVKRQRTIVARSIEVQDVGHKLNSLRSLPNLPTSIDVEKFVEVRH
jgi:hypothetical protein